MSSLRASIAQWQPSAPNQNVAGHSRVVRALSQSITAEPHLAEALLESHDIPAKLRGDILAKADKLADLNDRVPLLEPRDMYEDVADVEVHQAARDKAVLEDRNVEAHRDELIARGPQKSLPAPAATETLALEDKVKVDKRRASQRRVVERGTEATVERPEARERRQDVTAARRNRDPETSHWNDAKEKSTPVRGRPQGVSVRGAARRRSQPRT